MRLMIDIPDKIYETVQNGTYCGTLYEELKNGTPLEESEDCVSRQAVLNLAKFDGRDGLGSIIHAFDVEQLSPIKPTEKVGHWIDADVLDKIRAEIIKYEDDCRLSVDEYPSCKECTDNTFETIYAILDKYKASPTGEESEGGTQHDDC